MKSNFKNGSWQKVAPWYNKLTEGGRGHYYHEHVVIPGVIRLLGLSQTSPTPQNPPRLLDLACGNGVLAKAVPKSVKYMGVDIAPALISEAKRTDHNPNHSYFVADITKSLTSLNSLTFTHAAIVLALQNTVSPLNALKNAAEHLTEKGTLVIVLNHPAFRIPRQSAWGEEVARKIQYRRVDKYMSPMEIPIRMNPSDPNSQTTISYHFPISTYSKMLKEAGFVIDLIEEWTSDKESEGRAARMENRSRSEIPLFMAVKASKTSIS